MLHDHGAVLSEHATVALSHKRSVYACFVLAVAVQQLEL